MTTSQIATSSSPEDDLEWRAFRYLSDEMSLEERELLEIELETDLSACEAIARMTEVSLATSQLLQGEIKSAHQIDREVATRSHHWLGVVLAAAALVLVGIQFFSPPATSPKTETLVAADQIEDAAELLTRWNLPLSNLPSGNLEDPDGLDEIFATLPIEETSDREAEISDVPTWMVAALTLEDASLQSDVSSEMKDN